MAPDGGARPARSTALRLPHNDYDHLTAAMTGDQRIADAGYPNASKSSVDYRDLKGQYDKIVYRNDRSGRPPLLRRLF